MGFSAAALFQNQAAHLLVFLRLTVSNGSKKLRPSAHRTSPDVSIRPTLLLGQSGDGKLAFDQLQLSLRILAHKMVGCPSALDAKPFLQFRIPPDFRMSHWLKTYSMKLRRCVSAYGGVPFAERKF